MSPTYMVISPRDFVNAIRVLIEQKRARGYSVVIKNVEDFGDPPDPDAMRTFVLASSPACLLLVGDHDRTPSYSYQGEYDSDNHFGMEDDDTFPKVRIGRLSSNDTSILAAIARALVDYPADPGPNWKRRVILTGWCPRAREDMDPDDAGWRCVREIGSYFDVINEFGSRDATPDQQQVWGSDRTSAATLVEAISSGAAIVRYLGHGDWNLWGSIGQREHFLDTHVGLLNVGNRLPLVISAACVTGDIQRNSLAEAFQVQRRAIGVFAADVSSDTWWSERFVPRVFREIVMKGKRRVGDILLGAMRQVYDDYTAPPSGRDSTSATQSRIYRYLGDPDTILAVPEDDGINECRDVTISLATRSDGSLITPQTTIDFGKRVRRAWAAISGIDAEGIGLPRFSKLHLNTSIDCTTVTIGVSTSTGGAPAPLPPSTRKKIKVHAVVFALL